jgi:hypothetical protein
MHIASWASVACKLSMTSAAIVRRLDWFMLCKAHKPQESRAINDNSDLSLAKASQQQFELISRHCLFKVITMS